MKARVATLRLLLEPLINQRLTDDSSEALQGTVLGSTTVRNSGFRRHSMLSRQVLPFVGRESE
jgi:hypothetical protein